MLFYVCLFPLLHTHKLNDLVLHKSLQGSVSGQSLSQRGILLDLIRLEDYDSCHTFQLLWRIWYERTNNEYNVPPVQETQPFLFHFNTMSKVARFQNGHRPCLSPKLNLTEHAFQSLKTKLKAKIPRANKKWMAAEQVWKSTSPGKRPSVCLCFWVVYFRQSWTGQDFQLKK